MFDRAAVASLVRYLNAANLDLFLLEHAGNTHRASGEFPRFVLVVQFVNSLVARIV